MVEIQWYYRKDDLDFKGLGISEALREYMGTNEVFPTNH